MDINQLLERQQISLMRAEGAACEPSRRAHQGLADLYAKRIRDVAFLPPMAVGERAPDRSHVDMFVSASAVNKSR